MGLTKLTPETADEHGAPLAYDLTFNLINEHGDEVMLHLDSDSKKYRIATVNGDSANIAVQPSGEFKTSGVASSLTYELVNPDGSNNNSFITVDTVANTILFGRSNNGHTIWGTAYKATDLSKLDGFYNFLGRGDYPFGATAVSAGAAPMFGQMKIENGKVIVCNGGAVTDEGKCAPRGDELNIQEPTFQLTLRLETDYFGNKKVDATLDGGNGDIFARFYLQPGDLGSTFVMQYSGQGQDTNNLYAVKNRAVEALTHFNGDWWNETLQFVVANNQVITNGYTMQTDKALVNASIKELTGFLNVTYTGAFADQNWTGNILPLTSNTMAGFKKRENGSTDNFVIYKKD